MSGELKGMGDLVAKATKLVRVDKLAVKVAKTLGYEDCGCEKRKEEWNKAMPFRPPKNK